VVVYAISVNETALTTTTIIDAIAPYKPNDNSKGTYLTLRIAGIDEYGAMRIIKRKPRTVRMWREVDPQFRSLDSSIPQLAAIYCNQAKVLRATLLDINIMEAAIDLLHKILVGEPIQEGAWHYITKIASMRVPVMFGEERGASSWDKLLNVVRQMTQREAVISKGDATVEIRETTVTDGKLKEMLR